MKISLIQIESDGTKYENEEKAFKLLNEAVLEKPDFICLSELFLSWGKDFESGKVALEDIKKYQYFAMKNKVNIILGSVALKSNFENKITNTCFTINRDGKIVGRYDKKYMYKVDKQDFKINEEDDTIPGNDLGIAVLDNIKIGVGICFDLRFPEYFRRLVKNGVQVIFLPSHFRANTGKIAWDILPQARAIENQIYFCACNQTGEALCGNTKVISYDGTVLKSLDKEEGILTVDIDLQKQEEYRKEFPVLKQISI
jgi:nitrilase